MQFLAEFVAAQEGGNADSRGDQRRVFGKMPLNHRGFFGESALQKAVDLVQFSGPTRSVRPPKRRKPRI